MLLEIPTTLDELDYYNIDRKCWMCAHFEQWNSAPDRCGSKEQIQAVRDMLGVDFTNDLFLPVTSKTQADSCSEFLLSHDQAAIEEIQEILQDAAIEAQRHADHYRHLRRTVA